MSGVLLVLCYPGWNQGWLVWIALTPLIAAIWFSPRSRVPGRRDWLRDALLGYVAGVVFFAGTFYWLGAPLAALFQNRWLVAIPPLVASFMGLYLAFWGWFIGRLPGLLKIDRQFLTSGRNIGIGLVAASGWVAQEWVRGWFFFGGFGWNGLGVALHQNVALIQAADLAGVPGLSFVVAFANVIALITVRRLIAEAGRGRIRPHWDFSTMIASIVGVFSYGVHALQQPVDAPKSAGTVQLRFAAVQPDIPEPYKTEAHVQEIYNRYDDLTHTAEAWQPQLLMWPEAATLTDLYEPNTFEWLKSIAATANGAFFVRVVFFASRRR